MMALKRPDDTGFGGQSRLQEYEGLNGRAGRTQNVSQPDFTWKRLRKENPGVYESYVDLEPSAWTRIKIVVAGTKASLYVNGADQPCLIVNDLKLGETHGQVVRLRFGPAQILRRTFRI